MGALVSIGFLLGGCGGESAKNDEGLSPSEAREALQGSIQQVPLSQALNTGRTIWYQFIRADHVDKNWGVGSFWLFENGKATKYHLEDLTFGDLSKLTDDEILGLATDPEECEYTLSLRTDSTGNNVKDERLNIKPGNYSENCVSGSEIFTIYESQYGGYANDNTGRFLTRVEDTTVSFVLDEIGTEGIAVD